MHGAACESCSLHRHRDLLGRLLLMLETFFLFFTSTLGNLSRPALSNQSEFKVGPSCFLLRHTITTHCSKRAETRILLQDVPTEPGLGQEAENDADCDGKDAIGQGRDLGIALYLGWPCSFSMVEIALGAIHDRLVAARERKTPGPDQVAPVKVSSRRKPWMALCQVAKLIIGPGMSGTITFR